MVKKETPLFASPDLLERIASALGHSVELSQGMSQPDTDALLELAAGRLEKAAKIMCELGTLQASARRNGFTGESALGMIEFIRNNMVLKLGSTGTTAPTKAFTTDATPDNEAMSRILVACELLGSDAEMSRNVDIRNLSQKVNGCVRKIIEAAARIDALRTTVKALAA